MNNNLDKSAHEVIYNVLAIYISFIFRSCIHQAIILPCSLSLSSKIPRHEKDLFFARHRINQVNKW